MSTNYSARKFKAQEQVEGQEPRANWLFGADLNTMHLSISDRSGLVKLDLGVGRRTPYLYANEIRAILDKGEEILRYLEDHPQAKDTPPTKKQLAAQEAIVSEVNKAREEQIKAMVKAMRDGKVAEDVITQAVKNFKG